MGFVPYCTYNDDNLIGLKNGMNDITEIRKEQIHTMILYCLYLKNVYECTLQYMHKCTWKQYISEAIEELADSGIHNVKNEKRMMLLYTQSRDKACW